MRLPNTAHTSRPWRVHGLTRDFRLYDVWALPTPGRPDDFPRLVGQFASGDPSDGASPVGRALCTLQWKVGGLLGWDSPDAGIGSRVPTLRDRLPEDLREAPSGPDFPHFRSVFLLDGEWAAEIANRTVHGVTHIGWVPDGAGGHRGQMAVLVKPNGLFGTAYMAAIMPFRQLVVYPPLMREIGREWRASSQRAATRALRHRPHSGAGGQPSYTYWRQAARDGRDAAVRGQTGDKTDQESSSEGAEPRVDFSCWTE